jgi:hypothetical protein
MENTMMMKKQSLGLNSPKLYAQFVQELAGSVMKVIFFLFILRE